MDTTGRLHDAPTTDSYSSGMDDLTISGTISKIDDDRRQVFGWASVTEINGEPVVDLQNDYVDTYEVEKAAYDYVLNSRVGGEMHQRVKKDAPKQVGTLIESMVLTPEKIEKMGLPDETPRGWWIGFKVHDDEVWKAVKSDKYTGFSIHGMGKRIEKNFDEIGKAVKDRSDEEVRGWVNRMAETVGLSPQEFTKDLSEFLNSEGIDDPDDDDLHEFMVNTYGSGNISVRDREVGKHLIGHHKQKDHDPTKGKDRGKHYREDHDTAEGAARGAGVGALTGSALGIAGGGLPGAAAAGLTGTLIGGLAGAARGAGRGGRRAEIGAEAAQQERNQTKSPPMPKSETTGDPEMDRLLAMEAQELGVDPDRHLKYLRIGGDPAYHNDPSNRFKKRFLLAKAAQRATSRDEFLGYVDEIYKALNETVPVLAKAPEREPEQVGLSKSQIEVLEKYLGPISKKIEERDGKYVVLSESGKVLGTHETREKAQRQLAAVEANKDH